MKPEKLVYITKYNELTDEWTTFAVTNISYDGWQIGNVSDKHIYRSIARCYKYLKIAERKRIRLSKDKFDEAYCLLGELYTPPFPPENAR